jgi:enediyne biosynthesis protein E4
MRPFVPLLILWVAACSGERERPLFKLLTPEETGVAFANTITTTDSVNIQTDVYVYNGAGVAIGDIDNDGLSDIFFTGNMVSSRLYLNKGNMRFEDITDAARVGTAKWATGATMVDINNDGNLDIYISVSGPEWSKPEQRANALLINNGDRTFTEAASQYGIADTGFTTHAAFLDYDGDGCLDLFVLNNSPTDFSRGDALGHPGQRRGATPGSYNQLYRNDCRGKFTNASVSAGILRDVGYGLGVAVSDVNNDGWPDIYVSNDATPNDVLYVNNGNGTFTDKAGRSLKHASLAGMGVDIADYNNDGWNDIVQVDMMPRDLRTRKLTSGFMTYNSLVESRQRGFRQDYSINTLQLSNGVTPEGDVLFSEVARMAGVAATDWSWTGLFADLDNDGFKDIVITNGYPKAVNDYDYQTAMFAVERSRDSVAVRRGKREGLSKLHSYQLSNFVFRNSGDLTFTDKTVAWEMNQPSFSYGAAYADLDNNGTLDLVVNNIDAPAFIYQNLGSASPESRHWLQVRLQGETQRRGIGARLILTAGGQKQYLYHNPYRGYMSTMDDRAYFGLGAARRVDTLEVQWPDRRSQVLTGLDADRLVTIKQSEVATSDVPRPLSHVPRPLSHVPRPLSDVPRPMSAIFQSGRGPAYVHQLGTRVDYSVQPLLPYMISRQGPSIALGDVDRDGLQDVFVTGRPGAAGQMFIQQKNGSFALLTGQPWEADKTYEDWGALLFDANGDSLVDLYVASGGYQLAPGSPLLQDRLYINQGGGKFARDARAMPAMLTSTAAVRAGDFTGDGRPDLFVGGRLTPRSYPSPTRSYLLRNEGGRFVDVTEDVAPELVNPGGMITDAVWIDFDGDGRLDLVTAGEWMPLQFYRNEGGRFRNVTRSTGLPPSRGWWFSLATGDFDKDGRPDLVAGNLGLNYSYKTSRDSTFGVYASDFTGNRTTDVILTQQLDGKEQTLGGMVPLGRELYQLALRYPTYASFAQASVTDIFNANQLKRAVHFQTDTFASVYLHNEGGGKFTMSALPSLAQIAPIKGIVAHDVDGDTNLDLIVAGNLYDAEANTPPADAGHGLWLRGDGQGHFRPVPPVESGLLAPKNVAGLALLDTPAGKTVLVANTGDSLQAFVIGKMQKVEGGKQ